MARSRSRSTSRVRRAYRERSRSRSQRRRSDDRAPLAYSSSNSGSDFWVPYRCLIPPDCAGYLIGTGATLLKRLSEDTGAHVSVIHKDQSPKGLNDRIIVITGSMRSRNEALGWILERIRKFYDKDDRDREMFVCLIPDSSAPMVIGGRGACIRKIRDESGADVDVPSKNAPGMNDRGILIKGSVRETVSAVSEINRIVQEYVEKGRLVKSDFEFCDKFPGPSTDRSRASSPEVRRSRPDTPDDMPKFDVADDYVSRLPARFLITTEQADWLTSPSIVEKLREIETRFKTQINITDTNRIEAILSPQTDDNTVPEIIEIEGAFRNKINTTLEVLKLMSSQGPRATSAPARMLVPLSRSKYLVGVRGHTINAIKKASGGAVVKFADSKSPPDSLAKFLLNVLDISSPSSELDPVLEAVGLILRKLDHTVFEDESRKIVLDEKTREPIKRKSVGESGPTSPSTGGSKNIADVLSLLPSTDSEEQLIVHLSGNQMDAIEPELTTIQDALKTDKKCLHVNGSSLSLEGNRREILTAVWYLLESLRSSSGQPAAQVDRDDRDNEDHMVDYNEY